MTLAHPWFLLAAAAAAAAFAVLYRLIEKRQNARTLQYSNLAFLIGALESPVWPARVLTAVWVCAVALVVIAFAGPHVRAAVPVGGSVVLCVDTSGSMAATDVQPTRSQAALAALRAFIRAAPASTAVGIVSFSTGAQAIVSPTRDRERLSAAIDAVPAPNGATAIGDALAAAQQILPKTGHRVVVLITDGENTYGADPLAAARALGTARIPLYTVGIGTNSGALIPGTLQTAGINEDALRAYAAAAGGAYSSAQDAVQLRQALARLGKATSFERKNLDVSLASAEAGAVLMALAFLTGLAAGRFP